MTGDQDNNAGCIAVIGYGSRVPGANNPDEIWDILMKKIDTTDEIPESRHCKEQIQSHIKRGGFLKCPVDEFDAEFFGLSSVEAEFLDPRQRLLLEVTWESLEDSGIDPSTLRGSKTDVFVGLWSPDYEAIIEEHRQTCCQFSHKNIYLSSGHGVSSARISHFLGLHGYHESFDAGCSSSLISLHEGCASLQRQDCNLAIAAGVNLILASKQSKIDSLVLSPNGRCKTFDAEADGYARAEGISVLILKRLSDAIQDRDRIHAVIRGTGVNFNSSNSSFGNPERDGQILAIEEALKMSNLSPEDVNYLEAHGTGVLVGDTVEMEALATVYSRNRDQKNPLFVSSIKGNIGHSEAASGIAAIIKVILALEKEIIPPQFPFNKINPEVEKQLKKMHGEIPVDAVPWKRSSKKRFAAVSNFALGGENVHVILEEPPVENVVKELQREWHVLTLSAKCTQGLAEKIESNINFLQKNFNCNIADVVSTANCGRTHFHHRAAVVGRNIQDLEKSLRLSNYYKSTLCDSKEQKLLAPKICFIFKADLKPELSIVRDLHKMYPIFKDTFKICSDITENILNISLETLLEKHDQLSSTDIKVGKNEIIMTYAANYSLFKLWDSFGVKPSFIIANSETEDHVGSILGETIAGTLTVSEALCILARKNENKSLIAGNFCRFIYLDENNIPNHRAQNVNNPENSFISHEESMKTILAQLRNRGCKIFFAFGCASSEIEQYPGNDFFGTEIDSNQLFLETWKWSVSCKQDLWKLIALNLSQLYVNGSHICWDIFEAPVKMGRCKIDLPKYPFQRSKYWITDSDS